KFTLRYISAHQGVIGNERADKEAHKAANGKTSRDSQLPPRLTRGNTLPRTTETAKARYLIKLWEMAAARWAASARKVTFESIDRDYPFARFRRQQAELTRA
ncbi:hypothetical protein BDN70DRAFT_781548, partial [Pholiota conissans]